MVGSRVLYKASVRGRRVNIRSTRKLSILYCKITGQANVYSPTAARTHLGGLSLL
jgi:hypothetical protein